MTANNLLKVPTGFSTLLENTAHYGGATEWVTRTNPTKGYCIGDNRYSIKRSIDTLTIAGLLRWYNKMLGFVSIHPDYSGIGFWIDETNGDIYIDPVTWHDNLDEAIRIAKERNERCIYDIANNETIPTA